MFQIFYLNITSYGKYSQKEHMSTKYYPILVLESWSKLLKEDEENFTLSNFCSSTYQNIL